MGTWTGTTEPATLYDKDGKAYDATALHDVKGPNMTHDGKAFAPPSGEKPILIDEKGSPLIVAPGQQIEVTGTMKTSAVAHGPEGTGALSTKQGYTHVWGILVHGEPKSLSQ
jgi:hypothetical protein